jgi:hypothetical protein
MITPLTLKKRAQLLGAALALLAAARGDLLIERTLLPDAAPSSFAVGFPNGVSFCYDVTRGGVSYIWRGGFIDVTSVRPAAGKAITPVQLLGEVVYREEGFFPLRAGDPQRGVEMAFKGYRLRANAIEFHYEIERRRVTEEVALLPDGSGLVRRFRIEGAPAGEAWWYVPGGTSGEKLAAPQAAPDAGGFRFDAAREFSLEVHFKKETS